MKFYSVFSSNIPKFSRSFKINEDKSNQDYVFHRTKQQFKDECDINRIVQMYPDVNSDEYANRVSTFVNSRPDLFGEYDSAMDYSKAVEIVENARAQFDNLPSVLRERFGHNPYEFLDYINDSSNKEEAVSLGLLKKEIPVTNIEVPENPLNPVIQPVIKAETQTSQ